MWQRDDDVSVWLYQRGVQRCILGAHSCLTDTAIHHLVYQTSSGSAVSVLQLSIM